MQELSTQCPNCGHTSDTVLSVDEKTNATHGSICICGKCGNINKLSKELNLLEVTEDDMMLIKGISEKEYYEILEISATINPQVNNSKNQHERTNL